MVSVVCLLKGDLTVITLRNWIFFCCLFCLSLVDLEAYIIPDGCILISVIVWVLALPFSGMSWSEIGLHVLAGIGIAAAILLLSLAMDRILHRESMGGGDIKLFAAVGLYLGFSASLFSVILACLIGLLFALLRRILPGDRDALIPFGPSIAASAAVMLLFGGPLVEWYLQLLRAG